MGTDESDARTPFDEEKVPYDPDIVGWNGAGPGTGQRSPAFIRSRRRLLVACGYGVAHIGLLGIAGRRGAGSPGGRTAQAGAANPATPGDDGLVNLSNVLMDGVGSAMVPAMSHAPPEPPDGHIHDVVITNGRVIDPGTGYNMVANVGIDNGMIVSLGPRPLNGTEQIDATNRVVAPGFIDLLSYEPNSFGVWYKLADGVTTNLAMHGIANYAPAFFKRFAGTSPIHFGGAYHHHFMRHAEAGLEVEQAAGPSEIEIMEREFQRSLAGGMAGVSFSPEYSPGTSIDEMVRLAAAAAKANQVAFFHVRSSDPNPPGSSLEAVAEVIDIGRRTGVSTHIEHLSSTGGTHVMGEALAMIEQARSEGIDVTACVYPYDFWGTYLASSRFAAGWQQRYGITYEDLQVAGSDQRLDKARFVQAQAENKLVAAIGSIPEADIEAALAKPWVMVGSDAILNSNMNNHPRAAGTFARLLGRYVRERRVLDLPSALAKMTILPAERTEAMIPAMANKGRVRRGADADLVVFDPNTIIDTATVANPKQPSIGIDWVLVGGRVALANGLPQRHMRLGQPLVGSLWDGSGVLAKTGRPNQAVMSATEANGE